MSEVEWTLKRACVKRLIVDYRAATGLDRVGRVTTHLENLEKSGNSKMVREKSKKMEKVREKAGEVK